MHFSKFSYNNDQFVVILVFLYIFFFRFVIRRTFSVCHCIQFVADYNDIFVTDSWRLRLSTILLGIMHMVIMFLAILKYDQNISSTFSLSWVIQNLIFYFIDVPFLMCRESMYSGLGFFWKHLTDFNKTCSSALWFIYLYASGSAVKSESAGIDI